MNLSKTKQKIIELSNIVNSLNKKISILEKKYDFLEFCNVDFAKKNEETRNKLMKLLEKKETLENLFFCIINNFFPSFKSIGTNSLPDSQLQSSNQANNQINERRNSEIISQIYKMFNSNLNLTFNLKTDNILNEKDKLIKNLTNENLINNNNPNNLINNVNNNNQLFQLMENKIDNDEISNEKRDIQTFSKIQEYQKRIFNELDKNINLCDIDINKFVDLASGNDNINSQNNNDTDDMCKNSIAGNDDLYKGAMSLSMSLNDSFSDLNKNDTISKKSEKSKDNIDSDGVKDLL